MNDGTDQAWCSLEYVMVEEAAKKVTEKGAGALLAKVDIKQAYPNIPVHPDER